MNEFNYKNAVVPLIGLNILVFIIQMILGDSFTNAFLLNSAEVLTRPWILITHMFLHGSMNHIFFNMYALIMFGPLVEQRIGTKNFLKAYFASGILAAIVSTFFYSYALGASGAIMGIVGLTIILFPNMQVLLFFIIPVSMRTAGIIFALIDVIGIFMPNGVANIAHLVGVATGLIIGYLYIQKNKQKINFKRKTNKNINQKNTNQKNTNQKTINTKATNIELSEEELKNFIKTGKL